MRSIASDVEAPTRNQPDEVAAFRDRLFADLAEDLYGFHPRNTDYLRFGLGRGERAKRWGKDVILSTAARIGFAKRPSDARQFGTSISSLAGRADRLAAVHDLLADEHSKAVLVEVLRYRALGSPRVRLSLNDDAYWEAYRSVDSRFLVEERTAAVGPWQLNLYEVPGADGPMRLHAAGLGVLGTFVLEQYRYRKGAREIGAARGDVVIDGGACWGDTLLYFADAVGPEGRVYGFEFLPDNAEIISKNLARNPGLSDRVAVVPAALWSVTGESIEYESQGPATALVRGEASRAGMSAAETIRIDDFVRERGLARVDLLKMDIEGAELDALRGAEDTLRRWRPKLAISLYHSDDDFVDIPEYLAGLGLGYEFFLDHFTIHREETVLFGAPVAAPLF